MRAYSLRLAAGCGAVTTVLGLSGCGSETHEISTPTQGAATVGATGAQVEVGNTINYGSFGTTAEIDCANGKSLNVGGSKNTLTVKGTCSSVIVGGADNKITLEQIDKEVRVIGLNNTVTYQTGDPKIDDVGSGNSINKA